MHVLPALRLLCSSEQHGLIQGGRRSPEVFLRISQSGGLVSLASGDRSLITQLRVKVRALEHAGPICRHCGRLLWGSVEVGPQAAPETSGFWPGRPLNLGVASGLHACFTHFEGFVQL